MTRFSVRAWSTGVSELTSSQQCLSVAPCEEDALVFVDGPGDAKHILDPLERPSNEKVFRSWSL